MNFCNKKINSRSQYASIQSKKCHLPKHHAGRCCEFPFLQDLKKTHPAVAKKIERDSTMTTGAAWKSDDAGPNRILRWVMLLDDETLLNYGIDMRQLKPGVVDKLRQKAASYDECILSAIKLTWLAYQMEDAPTPSKEVREYLENFYGKMTPGSTHCIICKLPLSFELFSLAKRGRAEIETCHINPRLHNPENVGFGHRECNIAQGAKSLDEFYKWINDILIRVNK